MPANDAAFANSDPSALLNAETWVFDLDNTLYPASSRLFDQVDKNITRFIAQHLALEWAEAHKVQKTYFREHGTTMRGMMDNHGTDPADFLEFVHDIDLSPVDPAPALDRALARLPGRKIIFTNGSTHHAERVMNKLGVDHHFDAVFDIVDSDYVPKPESVVYDKLIQRHNFAPSTAIMVEDMAKNLIPAAALGMTTVWVRTDSDWARDQSEGGHIHHVVDDLADWLGNLTGT